MPLKPSAVHDPAPTGGVGTFPCQVKYDPQSAPTRAKSSKWVESMLGRSQFNPPPTAQESVAAASAQPHISSDAFRIPSLRFPLRAFNLTSPSVMLPISRVTELVLMVKVGIRERPNNLVQVPGYHHAVRMARPLHLVVETVGAMSLARAQTLVMVRVLPAAVAAHLIYQVRPILLQGEVDCSHLMTALKVLLPLMMLIANVVAVVLQELELGTVSHVVSAAV